MTTESDIDPGSFDRYESELLNSGLMEHLLRQEELFKATVSGKTYRGNPYGFAGMKPEVSRRLYGLIRDYQPKILVETGVCNGVSTAVILAALEKNGQGKLHSIDLPEFTDTDYTEGDFWEGKKGAVIPKEKPPGWIIPDDLKSRWELQLGRSDEVLPSLLDTLGTIDFFLHDSEHSYQCMTAEYHAAWGHLAEGGILASDDISWNTAFQDFAKVKGRTPIDLARNIAFIVK